MLAVPDSAEADCITAESQGQDRLDTVLYYFIFSCLEQSPLGWLTYLWGGAVLQAGFAGLEPVLLFRVLARG